jgi:hypothetical protein
MNITIRDDNLNWLILDERDGRTLLLASDITGKRQYNDTRFCAAWEDSTLKAHLGERFLLSVEEADRYFADNTARIASGAWGVPAGKPWAWWLRDIGIKNHAAFVGKDGEISVHGYRVDCAWCGVRPAMWIRTEEIL